MPQAAATETATTTPPTWVSLKSMPDGAEKFASHSGFDDMQQGLVESNNRGLILYDTPVIVVALLLEQGVSASDALDKWRAEASAILDFLRLNRRKLVLAERPGGAETLQSLSAFFPNITPSVLAFDDADVLPAARQLAEVLLTLDRSAFAIWSELQASSVGYLTTDIEPITSVGQLAAEWHSLSVSNRELARDQNEIGTALQAQVLQLEDSLKATENLRQQAAHSQETNAARIAELNTQLNAAMSEQIELNRRFHAAQGERDAQAAQLERLSVELSTAQSRAASLDSQLSAETQRADQKEADLKRSRKSEELLVTQVRELEGGLRAKVEESKHHIQELKSQLDAMYASNSWRITAPIRAVVIWWRG